MTVIPFVFSALGTYTRKFREGTERYRIKRKSGDHPDYSIIKIGQNTEMCPGDWRYLVSPKLKWKPIS